VLESRQVMLTCSSCCSLSRTYAISGRVNQRTELRPKEEEAEESGGVETVSKKLWAVCSHVHPYTE